MKGIFIAGVIAVAAFTITVVDSLDCKQCHSSNNTCDANVNVTACEEGSLSCVESSVNSTLGGVLHLYQNKSCSALNCIENNNTEVAFTVYLLDNQTYHFVSQCCQGAACTGTHYEPAAQNSTEGQCKSCYAKNGETCKEEKLQQCYKGEQCVHIITERNGTEELKGCSDISNSTCELLSKGNVAVGEFIFKSVQCTIPEPITPPTTPPTTVTPQASMGTKASFTSSIFGSLLLLKLLL